MADSSERCFFSSKSDEPVASRKRRQPQPVTPPRAVKKARKMLAMTSKAGPHANPYCSPTFATPEIVEGPTAQSPEIVEGPMPTKAPSFASSSDASSRNASSCRTCRAWYRSVATDRAGKFHADFFIHPRDQAPCMCVELDS